jgi:hypothetical protein
LAASDSVLAELSEEVGDTLFLTVRTGNDTLCIDRRIGSYPIQVLAIEIGARRPLGVSSGGVAILAAMLATEARKIIVANEARFAAYRVDGSRRKIIARSRPSRCQRCARGSARVARWSSQKRCSQRRERSNARYASVNSSAVSPRSIITPV